MSRYSDAVEDGYDGPSPFESAREANAIRRNYMLDCRDPDHEGCASCEPDEEEKPLNLSQEEIAKILDWAAIPDFAGEIDSGISVMAGKHLSKAAQKRLSDSITDLVRKALGEAA